MERVEYLRALRRRSLRDIEYPQTLRLLPNFEVWLVSAIQMAMDSSEEVAPDVIDISIGPARMATSYRSMWAYGNHFRVKSAERNLTTIDCGVVATFEQECRSGPQDQNTIMAQVEYVGWVEEILELDYGRFQVIVFLCNWVKAISQGPGTTMKRDEYGFTLVNFNRLIPISAQSFVFPIQVEQVFFSDTNCEQPGCWKVVLRKEVRARRTTMDMNREIGLLSLGDDTEFLGLVAPEDGVINPIAIPALREPNAGISLTVGEIEAANRELEQQEAEEVRELLSSDDSDNSYDMMDREQSSNEVESPIAEPRDIEVRDNFD